MKVHKKRWVRPFLLLSFAAIGLATCFNCVYYRTGPVQAFRILADGSTGKVSQLFRPDDVGPSVELQLREAGFGQLFEPSTGRLLDLSFVTGAGRAYDGAPVYHAFYKSKWNGARLMAYFSNGKIHLFDFCDGVNFNCKYLRPDQARTLAEKQAQNTGPVEPDLDKNGLVSLAEGENLALMTRENRRPGIEPPVPVNRAPAEKTYVGKQAVLKEMKTGAKDRPVKVAMPIPENGAADPFEQIKIPALVQPWLGKWSGDFMAANIVFRNGKLHVGRSEAKLKGSELVF